MGARFPAASLACHPAPYMPTRLMSSLAMYLVATPDTAPVAWKESYDYAGDTTRLYQRTTQIAAAPVVPNLTTRYQYDPYYGWLNGVTYPNEPKPLTVWKRYTRYGELRDKCSIAFWFLPYDGSFFTNRAGRGFSASCGKHTEACATNLKYGCFNQGKRFTFVWQKQSPIHPLYTHQHHEAPMPFAHRHCHFTTRPLLFPRRPNPKPRRRPPIFQDPSQ